MPEPSTPSASTENAGADSAAERLAAVVGRRGREIAFAVVALCSAVVLWTGRIDLAFTPGMPFSTDLGGHYTALKHLTENSLPNGALRDWSHQWFSGYPSFYFYFPLPALLIAALSLLLPLHVAVKATAIVAPALLPPAVYLFTRTLGYGRLHATCAAVASLVYLTLTAHYIFGGNILASVIGEYSYSIALLFAFWYLGCVARALRGERVTASATIALAALSLSHLIPTIFAVLASTVALRDRRARVQVLASWVVAFALSAFWSVPFLLRSRFMGSIDWAFTPSLSALFPLPLLLLLPFVFAWPFILRPMRRELWVVIALTVAGGVAYLVPQTFFTPARGLPVWQLGLTLLTGLGIASGLQAAWSAQRRISLALWSAGLVLLVGIPLVQIEIARPRAAQLLATTPADAEEFDSLLPVLRALPSGMLHWEQTDAKGRAIGGLLALGRVPGFAPDVRTTAGLLRESAFLSPVHVWLLSSATWDTVSTGGLWTHIAPPDRDASRVEAVMKAVGVDHFVGVTDGANGWAAEAGFDRKASTDGWTLWRTGAGNLVQPLSRVTIVQESLDWKAEVAGWIREVSDTSAVRVVSPALFVDTPEQATSTVAPVDAQLGYNTIRFTTSAVGTPHLVRVAYFPNWRAYNADGPYLAVPGFMVVVPTAPEVTLRFESTPVDLLGKVLSGLGLVLLAWLVWRQRRLAAAART